MIHNLINQINLAYRITCYKKLFRDYEYQLFEKNNAEIILDTMKEMKVSRGLKDEKNYYTNRKD